MKIGLISITFLLVLVGCKKPPSEPVSSAYENGVLVLNEGLFEQNNASLSFYSYAEGKSYQLAFQAVNSRGLGDTANDFETYSLNGKAYVIIAVDVSSQVEIIERYTLKSVAQIPLFDGENAREPRRVSVYGTFAYVCNYDGTVAVIDLVTYEVVKLIEVGANPDGMVIIDDRLYVANSGGLNYPVYDETMSVIDLATNTVVSTFTTRINCAEMEVDLENDIYLISSGNYGDINRALLRVNTTSNSVEEIIERPMSSITQHGKWLYFYDSDQKGIYRLNTATETFDPTKYIDCSEINTFYGLHIDPVLNRFYITDANSYVNSSTIYVYNKDGVFVQEIKAGLNANTLIFN